jgi:Putative DNA-binding domain
MTPVRDELTDLLTAISTASLPSSFDQIFSRIWDEGTKSFHAQETTLLDFKEDYSESYTDPYGVGLVRCALVFYNTYGGLIVFGVKDRDFTVAGVPGPFAIERFNRALSDFTGVQIECLAKTYSPTNSDGKLIGVVLVPRRELLRPATLNQNLGKYPAGTSGSASAMRCLRHRRGTFPSCIPLA